MTVLHDVLLQDTYANQLNVEFRFNSIAFQHVSASFISSKSIFDKSKLMSSKNCSSGIEYFRVNSLL